MHAHALDQDGAFSLKAEVNFVFCFSRGILRSFTLMTCGEGAFRHLDKVFSPLRKLNRFTIAGKPSRATTSLAKSEIPC